MRPTTRRTFIAGTTAAGIASLAGCIGDDEDDVDVTEADDTDIPDDDDGPDWEAGYEIWAADQGTDIMYIYEPGDASGENFDLVDEFDLSTNGGRPHMVHFTSDYEYAAVANAAGPVIIRTADREIVAEPETGGGTHFAGFSPDDEWLIVDVIGDNKIVRIDVDIDEESFEVADEIVPSDEIDDIEDTQNPVCHSWDHSGRTIHTLGPAYGDGGVVIVDQDTFEIDVAWPGEDLPANCGTIPHPDEDKFYLTAGAPSDPDEGVEGAGEYYVLDTAADEILVEGDTAGVDAHGFWYTTDGEELWVLNRETNDGVIIDPDSDDVVDEIDAYGPDEDDAPDILWGTPDGQHMIVTLRGDEPVTGDPHAATGVNPGFAVLDVETRDVITNVVPDDDDPASDFHGIGIKPLVDADGLTSPPF